MEDFNASVFLLSVAGAIILILISAVAFFLKPLLRAIDQLKDTVNELRLVVELQKQEAKSSYKLCDMKHAVIERRLNELENIE